MASPTQVTGNISGIISEDQVWSGVINVTNSIKVTSGTITIQPGTTINVESGNSAQIWFDGGQLNSQGTALNPVDFQTDDTVTYQQSEWSSSQSVGGGWIGLRFTNDSTTSATADDFIGSNIQHTQITGAAVGVYVENQGLLVEDVLFDSNQYDIVLGPNTDGVRIENSVFTASEDAGFDSYLPDIETGYSKVNLNIPYSLYDDIGTSSVENVWIHNNEFEDGVKIWQNQRIIDNVFVDENIFGSEALGLQIGGGGYGSHIRDLEVTDNLFLSENGIHLDAYSWTNNGWARSSDADVDQDSIILIKNNAYVGEGRGFYAGHADSAPSNLSIEENLYMGSGTAIGNGSFNGVTLAADIRFNIFSQTEKAIDLPSASVVLEDNAFVNATGSIYTSISSNSTFNNNNIEGYSGSQTFETSEDPATAYSFSGNYFDSTSLANLVIDDGSSTFTEATISVVSNASTPNTAIESKWASDLLDPDTSAFNEGQTVTAITTLIPETFQAGSVSFQWFRDGVERVGETAQTYQLTSDDIGSIISVKYSYLDQNGDQQTHLEWLTTKVLNVNDAPAFASSTASVSVAENSDVATAVYTASATDVDGDTLTYSLSGTDASLLTIDSSTGAVTLKASPDYDTKDQYLFTVTASDGSLTDTVDVTLNVTDVNEPPVFASQGSDPLASSNTAEIVGDGWGDEVLIVSDQHGIVRSALPASTDVSNYYQSSGMYAYEFDAAAGDTTVLVTYSGEREGWGGTTTGQLYGLDGTRIGSEFVLTTQTDQGHRNSVWHLGGDQYLVIWQTNSPNGYPRLEDMVQYIVGRIYDAKNDVLEGTFIIDYPNNVLESKVELSIGENGSYVASWEEYSIINGNLTTPIIADSTSLAGLIPDEFQPSTFRQIVAENSAASTVVYAADASDPEGDPLIYSLAGSDAALLNIDPTTGEVRLNSPADYETKTQYSFSVIATEDVPTWNDITFSLAGNSWSYQTNIDSTTFAFEHYLSVDWTVTGTNAFGKSAVATGTTPFYISEGGADREPYLALVNSIQNELGPFVDPFQANGLLKEEYLTQNIIDAWVEMEWNRNYGDHPFKTDIASEILQQSTPEELASTGLSASNDVLLYVTNVNDIAPTLTLEDTHIFPLQNSSGYAISYQANDPEGDNLNISFSDPERGSVTENGDWGIVYTPDARETGEDNFTVFITDGVHTVSEDVRVTIQEYDSAPVFDAYQFSWADAIDPGNAYIYDGTATETVHEGHYYRLLGENVSFYEAISLASAQTFNGVQGHLASISSSSSDYEENQQIFEKFGDSGYWLAISDDETEGVWKHMAGLQTGQRITMSVWDDGSQGGSQEPNGGSGENFVESGGRFNHMWNDASGYSPFNVIVEFDGDYGLRNASVVENSVASTVVHTVTATDPDGDTVTYSLQGTDSSDLSIDSRSGEIRLNAPADYETKSQYEFTVVARGGSQASTLDVTLRVEDVAEYNLAPDITESNEAFGTAFDVNGKSGLSVQAGFAALSGLRIDGPVDNDFYFFSVDTEDALTLTVEFSHAEGDIDVNLYDVNRNYLSGSSSSTDNETVTIDGAGEYYLKVFGYAGDEARYSITANSNTDIQPDYFESNDSILDATRIGILANAQAFEAESLTIHSNKDDDYFQFELTETSNLNLGITFDAQRGDLDLELLDQFGNLIDSSASTLDSESITVEELGSGTYFGRVFGYGDATSDGYAISASAESALTQFQTDAYEKNDSIGDAYNLGLIQGAVDAVAQANLHSGSDHDFYKFSLAAGSYLGLEVLFSHSEADVDIELLDSSGLWIDSSTTSSDNEYLSLAGLSAGDYALRVYGYNGATIDDYSVRFVEEQFDDWQSGFNSWWEWQESLETTQVLADSYEDNDTELSSADLGIISDSTEFSNLTIDQAGDVDWYRFTYDPSKRVDVSIAFDGGSADLDLELYDAQYEWIDGSYGTQSLEEVSLVGLEAGEYFLKVYEYSNHTVDDYDMAFSVADASSAADLNDQYEPNNTFLDATDLGNASGEGAISNLSITSGDEDWFKAYFVNSGTADQYVGVLFDHQDGDIDIELYDAQYNILRSSVSSTDNERISLADIDGDAYYYLRVYQFGAPSYQEYSLDYAFPIDVAGITVASDTFDADQGNDSYENATVINLETVVTGLTLHSDADQDWFTFDLRNTASNDSSISIEYDESFGEVELALYAIDVGDDIPVVIDVSSSGTGREVIDFGGYVSGTYYLKVSSTDSSVIPLYQLGTNVAEIEESQANSGSVPVDQFDLVSDNDSAATATNLGVLSSALTIEGLSIHSTSDVDYLSFETRYAGLTDVHLDFSHDNGDIDVILRDSSGSEIASSFSGDDDESLSFQSQVSETYTLEVFGFDGALHRDYDLTVTPKQLNSRRDEYENNNNKNQAVDVRAERASFEDLTMHNANDEDWFEFSISASPGSTNKVQVTEQLGAAVDLTIYSSDGSTVVASASIDSGSSVIDTSDFDAGDYFAVVSSQADQSDAESSQVSNYDLYIDQSSAEVASEAAEWTVMVYIAGDNNLASAAVDDLNEMEGVILPDNVNVVTLTDLSDEYLTSEIWTDTRRGEISPDPNGYNPYGWAGGAWSRPADALTSDLQSVGELNMGDPQNLTDFIDWSTTNHAAENYALVIWDHGGGLSGIAWDDTSNHDNLSMAEIKSAIENTQVFSSSNKLDLIGFDACLMQTFEVGYELSELADVMVASQETEPGDGWDYQAFLSELADNPYASNETLGRYIVETYDAWYDSSSETLSSVDLSGYQAIDDAITSFNNFAITASGSDWLVIDDAFESAWSSSAWDYGRHGDEYDLGQAFTYISENAGNGSLAISAGAVVRAIENAVLTNSSRQGLEGIQGGLLSSDSLLWSGSGLVGKSGTGWGAFQQLYDVADRSVRSATAENLAPDYSETRNALGGVSQGNNTSLTAFDLGYVSNSTQLNDLTIHNPTDIDWYQFSTPEGIQESGSTVRISSTNEVLLNVSIYDSDKELITQREALDNAFNLASSSEYYLRVATVAGRQDIEYSVDVDLTSESPEVALIVPDIAEGRGSNDLLSKASEIGFSATSEASLANLGLSLTEDDQDWFKIDSGRISEQSPNLFSVIVTDESISEEDDIIIEIADANGTVLTESKGIGRNETVIFEGYDSDVFVNVRSATGKTLDYKLDLRYADYDFDKDGSVTSDSDGAAIVAALFADSSSIEIAMNLSSDADSQATAEDFFADYRATLLDVDGDGVTLASTDGVILNAYIAGASAVDLLPYISDSSPIQTADDLLTHLLDLA